MAPAKGNQHAVGHGRPPNPGFEDEDLVALGEEFVAWMDKVDSENDYKVVHLSQWFSKIKNIPISQWDSIIRRECFIGYYKKAILWMGTRTLINKELPTAYGSRFINIYFKDVKAEEREEVEHKIDHEIKKKMEHEATRGTVPNDLSLTGLLNGLHSIKENDDLKAKIAILEAKLDASQPKTDPIIQPGDQTV